VGASDTMADTLRNSKILRFKMNKFHFNIYQDGLVLVNSVGED